MPDSEDVDAIDAAIDDLRATVEQVRPLLSGGEVTVSTSFAVTDVSTPQEAVEKAMLMMARSGYDNLFFEVLDDDTGERYVVQGGVLFQRPETPDEPDDDGSA